MAMWARVGDRLAYDLLRLFPKATFSTGIGWIARRRVPRPLRAAVYGGFARYAGADLSVLDRPIDAFERFDDFFTRPLPEGARPVDARPSVVVSPVDGTVSEVGVATAGRLIQAKGLDYSVEGLLADANAAAPFRDGPYATLYLAPRDYHRIHAPVAGRVVGYRHVPGAFYPVNALSVRSVPGLFSINERIVTYIESELGRVAVVKVAATGVGNISLSYEPKVRSHVGPTGSERSYRPGVDVERGQELGMFHLGSTVIVLFEPGRVALDVRIGEAVRVGAAIGSPRRSVERGS
jgi:phosphatidylserine decarboxylase